MTTLREAAQQALEALEVATNCLDGYYIPRGKTTLPEIEDAIDALKAALVEDAMQKFTDVNQELMAALGCDHCNSPLYAATRCRVCGRETPIIEPKIKRDNKPVAWIQPDHLQKARVAPFLCRVEPTQRCSDFVALYTAPPQRKPLTEWQINDLMANIDPEDVDSWSFRQGVYATEKHHGVRP